MAEQTEQSVVTLGEFVATWKGSVESNPYAVFVAMAQCDDLALFGVDPDRLAWVLTNEHDLKEYIQELFAPFADTEHVIEKNLERTRQPVSTRPTPPKDTIEHIGTVYKERAAKNIRPDDLSHYARDYTNWWVSKLREDRLYQDFARRNPERALRLDKAIEARAIQELAHPGNIAKSVQWYVNETAGVYIRAPITPEIPGAARWQAGVITAATDLLSKNSTLTNVDEYYKRVSDKLEHPEGAELAPDAARAAYLETRAAEVLSSDISSIIPGDGGVSLFNSYTKTLPPVIGKVIDGAVSFLPKPLKDQVIKDAPIQALLKSLEKFEKSTQNIGELAAQSKLLRDAIQHAGLAGERQKGATSLFSGITNAVGDVVTTFRSDEHTAAFLTAIREHPGQPVEYYIHTYAISVEHMANPEALQMAWSGTSWVAQRVLIKNSIFTAMRKGLGQFLIAAAKKVGIEKAVLSVIGGPTSWIAAGVGFLFNLLKGAAEKLRTTGEPAESKAITLLLVGVLLVVFLWSSSSTLRHVYQQLSTFSATGGGSSGDKGGGGIQISYDPNQCGGNIAAAALTIQASLYRLPGFSYFTKSSLFPNISLFWCTLMVAKSYELAGELFPQNLWGVIVQKEYFVNNGRYVSNGATDVKSLPVGTAVIWNFYDRDGDGHAWEGHTATVVDNPPGEPFVTIIESNNSVNTRSLSVINGRLQDQGSSGIQGFGLPPCATLIQ